MTGVDVSCLAPAKPAFPLLESERTMHAHAHAQTLGQRIGSVRTGLHPNNIICQILTLTSDFLLHMHRLICVEQQIILFDDFKLQGSRQGSALQAKISR
jgi:hypothetical protein